MLFLVFSGHSDQLSALDLDPQSILPIWPIAPESLLVEDGVYEQRAVTIASIAFVTDLVLKVGTSGSSTWQTHQIPRIVGYDRHSRRKNIRLEHMHGQSANRRTSVDFN